VVRAPSTLLFLTFLAALTAAPLAQAAQGPHAGGPPGASPGVLELRYVYSAINSSHFEEAYLSYLGGRLPPLTEIAKLHLGTIKSIVAGSASALGLGGYKPGLVVFLTNPHGALLGSCMVAAENASATVRLSGSKLVEEVRLYGALLTCVGNSTSPGGVGGALALASRVLSALQLGVEPRPLNLSIPGPGGPVAYSVAAAYLGSVAVNATGSIDWGRWAVLDGEGRYVGDLAYLLPRAVNDSAFLLAALTPMSVGERLEFEREFNASPEGWALLYCVNLSDTTNLTYTVRGLGVVPGYDTAYAPCPTLGGEVSRLYRLSSPSQASRLASRLREALGGSAEVVVEDSVVRVRWSTPLLLGAYAAGGGRYWSMSLCNTSVENVSVMGSRVLELRESWLCLRVGDALYAFSPSRVRNEGLLVYSRSRGLLLEAVGLPSGIIAGASPTPAGLAWGRLAALSGFPRIALLGLPDGFLSARLAEARGLQGAKPFSLEARGRVGWYRSMALASLIVAAVSSPLLATRRPLVSLGALLLALGLGAALSGHAAIASGGSRVVASGSASGFNLTIYVYGDSSDRLDMLVQAGECFYNVTLDASAAGVSRSSTVEEAGSSSGSVSLGDPMIYRVGLRLRAGEECRRLEVMVEARGSPSARPLAGLARAGLLVAAAGALLASAGLLAPRRRGSLWSWGLEASYLYIMSAVMVWVLLYTYMALPVSCKLGGLCVGYSPREVFAWATRLPAQAYTLLVLYSIIVAGILYPYHHEAGLDRRLHLLGVGRLRLQLYKLAALTALVALPYTAVRALLGTLAGPGLGAGPEASLVVGSLAGGAVLALAYGGAAGILGVVLGRLSYTLLIVAPAALALLSTVAPGRVVGAFEWPAWRLMGLQGYAASGSLFWYHAAAAVAAALLLVFLGAWRGREL
jgi:hypothetical protein